MTKGQFTELIKQRLGWKWGDRTIALHIENAWNQVVGQLFLNDSHQLDLYTKTYTVDVLSGTPRKYSLLPVKSIQYKDAANGVRRIHTLCDEQVHFVPMRGIDFQIFSSLDAGIVNTDVVGYLSKTDRVEYFDIIDDISQVRMDIVPAFSAWGETDDIMIPQGVAESIYGLVLQAVQGNAPTDFNIFKDQAQIADNKDL
jgi:hypothetical protein